MEPTALTPPVKASKKKLVWGLICLIGPTALLILALLLYAVVNFITSSTTSPAPNDETLFAAEPSAASSIVNIFLFLAGAISILTWLPGIIVGIILLSTRKK